LLLDEPFSSLDQAMRTQLRGEVRQILREARQSAILVTHDQDEALTIADRVAVMSRGRIEQIATPEIIYAAPETAFVATFVGVANLVHGEAREGVVHTRFGTVPLLTGGDGRPEGTVLALLRPEHFGVREAPDGPAGPDAWVIRDRRFSGSEILLEVTTSDGDRLWVAAGGRVRHLTLGDRVELRLRAVETVAFGRHGHDAAPAHGSHAPSAPEPADLESRQATPQPAAPITTQHR
jgi:ABC-type Fe3+/spermidine/putrescine transport system ATPase subunit